MDKLAQSGCGRLRKCVGMVRNLNFKKTVIPTAGARAGPAGCLPCKFTAGCVAPEEDLVTKHNHLGAGYRWELGMGAVSRHLQSSSRRRDVKGRNKVGQDPRGGCPRPTKHSSALTQTNN